MSDGTILVLGATGNTGRLVVEGLRARGRSVRPAARSLGFDWHDPGTWPAALTGAAAVYMVTPMLPDFPAELVTDFVAAADTQGVRRLVLLSGLSAGYGSRPLLSREEPVRAAKADWTILRPGAFDQNFSLDGVHGPAIRAGEVRMPLGPGPGPYSAFIDVRDIADVAVEVLIGEGHAGRVYDLAGPRALTYPEAVAMVAEALGRPVRFVNVPLDEWTGHPWSAETYEAIRRGEYAPLHDGVRRVLGRDPRDFADYARELAEASS
ncbi:NAD(P)H-binding protein [Actinomadura barringtoniae]|uniref:NAD(P)H-binding protein n=1 Tax=Actinomadura barringtoniae TaxID=1427535 RepID=A0A939T4V7_9ACTN|nr:NAD(P)H-binding protein [Actinomadura barringtoniae]MBO2453021.1 NAD(P)H-binding protein [Actinomadura barringtoniae]